MCLNHNNSHIKCPTWSSTQNWNFDSNEYFVVNPLDTVYILYLHILVQFSFFQPQDPSITSVSIKVWTTELFTFSIIQSSYNISINVSRVYFFLGFTPPVSKENTSAITQHRLSDGFKYISLKIKMSGTFWNYGVYYITIYNQYNWNKIINKNIAKWILLFTINAVLGNLVCVFPKCLGIQSPLILSRC